MAEIYGPFDAGPGAAFGEDGWNKLMRALAPDGVIFQYATEMTTPYVGPEFLGLKVTANGGLTYAVGVGLANVHGHLYENTTSLTRTVGTPGTTGGQSRNDLAVVRMDKTANTITVTTIPGTNAVNPVDPPMLRTPTEWDVPLARINVPANAVNLGTITDLRPWAWLPYSPFTHAYATSEQTLNHGALTAIDFHAEIEDVGNAHSTVTNRSRFTPTISGRYEFHGLTTIYNSVNSIILAQFRKNGSVVAGASPYRMNNTPANGTVHNSCSSYGVFNMNGTTDYVQLYTMQVSAGAVPINTFASSDMTSMVTMKWLLP